MSPKAVKPLTEEEKFMLQLKSEDELIRLHRQYVILEKSRNTRYGGSDLHRLNKVLSVTKKEHQNLLNDLQVATSSANKNIDEQDYNHLASLVEAYGFLDSEMSIEKQLLKEIDDQTEIVRKDVVKLKASQSTGLQDQERHRKAMKTVEALENKLDVQTKMFCTLCASNREMRNEINGLLWMRKAFLKDWNKLIERLVLGKGFMLDLIEQATIAYDQREAFCSKLQALRMKAHNDLISHTQDMRLLQRKQDHLNKLRQFVVIKGQRREMRDLKLMEENKRIQKKEKLAETLQKFQSYVDEILEFTKETDIEKIAQVYHTQEMQNFSLFLHVNDLIQELERYNDRLGCLHLDIDEQRVINEGRESKQAQKLELLATALDSSTNQIKDLDGEFTRLNVYLSSIFKEMETLFKICRCDWDPIHELLGDNTNVNMFNFQFFLKLIEECIHDALITVYYKETTLGNEKKITKDEKLVKDGTQLKILYTLEDISGSTPCSLCFAHGLTSDVIDTVQHVMTRDQVETALRQQMTNPEMLGRVHNVSKCLMPEARLIMQHRYV